MPQKQTKNRSKVHRALTKRLHHNRWFIWAITIIILAMGTLYAYIEITSIDDSAQQSFLGLQPRPEYSNQALGFMVDYPAGWVIDSSSNSSVTFDNPKDNSESVSVSVSSVASIAQLKKTPTAKIENAYNLRGNQVTIMNIEDPEGGQPTEIGIIQTASKAYFVTGQSAQFNAFINDIRPL